MRSFTVVALSPIHQNISRLKKRGEVVLIEALIAKPTVKALDERVLYKFAGSDMVESNAPISRPAWLTHHFERGQQISQRYSLFVLLLGDSSTASR